MSDAGHFMDARSEAALEGVHPDLCKVIRAAAQQVKFLVIHGLRTPAEEASYVAAGRSQTTHSRHLPGAQGYACAVDVAALADGHVSWDSHFYAEIWVAIQRAAKALGVPVQWGGDWITLKDLGHFQLPWSTYP